MTQTDGTVTVVENEDGHVCIDGHEAANQATVDNYYSCDILVNTPNTVSTKMVPLLGKSDGDRCSKKCTQLIPEERRKASIDVYWSMIYNERRSWGFHHVSRKTETPLTVAM